MSDVITASMLYNFVQCPHRVTLDLFGDYADCDPISPFVQLLWDRGHAFELEVVERLSVPFTNLSQVKGAEKEVATREAMARGDNLIYSGRISVDDLVGEPDLLRRLGSGYVAGDIKSGAGLEGASEDSDGKPKKHYAVQLALYTDILERLGLSAGQTPFIWDVHGEEVTYYLDMPQGVRNTTTLWETYQDSLANVRLIISNSEYTRPALAGDCKLCHWRTVCVQQLVQDSDLTCIPELGRARRDVMVAIVPTLTHLAQADITTLIQGKKTVFPGIGVETLRKFQDRAKLLVQPGARPYAKQPITLPVAQLELFFDIETDPMRNICYLHGFLERRRADNTTERFVPFLAETPTPEEEERAFAEAWQYVKSCQPCTIYYYSKYERTWWRALREKYPIVSSENEIEAMFNPTVAIDLYYDVVRPCLEWPTRDHSIKTLASYLGFHWRDTDPSGAASIEWYHCWVKSGDQSIRQRILDYNEDDCVAMRVLVDAIREIA